MQTRPTDRRRPVLAARAVLSFSMLCLAWGSAEGLEAQRRVNPAAEAIQRRIQNISPNTGPVGTVVAVSSGLMPAITPVRIGIGASRTGFEAFEEVLTSPRGEFAVQVPVPEWARWDRSHRFIVFDFYFQPIALSEPFHVTDERGLVQRQGEITGEGTECLAMRDLDGDLYTLVGDTDDLAVGDAVVVEGSIAASSTCQQGSTIRIVRLREGAARGAGGG